MKPKSTTAVGRHRKSMPYRLVRERGVILFVTLIAMLMMMIAGIALVRSFDSSLVMSGNLAFKRDLVNQGERGIYTAVTWLNSTTDATRQANSLGNNYSATMLPSDSHGIPTALLNDSAWTTDGFGSTNDISDTKSLVTIRYVIDRMCISGTTTETATACVNEAVTESSTSTQQQNATLAYIPVAYRISVRVTLPNNTQTFLQSTGIK
jgi:Tfp pilus assembly protein PilX